MPEFKYKARDRKGRIKSGKMDCTTKSLAKDRLRKMQLRPVKLVATKLDGPGGSKSIEDLFGEFLYRDDNGAIQLELIPQTATIKDVIIFTKQFATMLNSGVALVQALDILSKQQRVRSFGRAIAEIRHAVENGATLSESMEAYPKIFDSLFIAMVRAGEASGNLDSILMKLTGYIENASKIKSQIKSAMMYPSFVLVIAVVVISALLMFVVPTFKEQFAQGGQELPELTQIVVGWSDWLKESWLLLVGEIFVAVVIAKLIIRTPAGRRQFDSLKLRLPGIGNLIRKVAVGRFCSTMSTMLISGVNLLEALDICAASAGNVVIEAFIKNVRLKIEQGSKFSTPLEEGDIFPPMVVSMVAVGEASGALDEMLGKVSEFYEEEVELAVKGLISMVEPIMIVTIGGSVGFVLIAMYLPVFDLGNIVG